MPYVVMVDDRHHDPYALLYFDRQNAIDCAESIVADAPHPEAVPDDERSLSPEQLAENEWIFYRCYSVEGDSVWVYATDFEDAHK